MSYAEDDEEMWEEEDMWLRDANLLLHQFENENRRRSWENKDYSSQLKFLEDRIRMVGVCERTSRKYAWKEVCGLEETLSAIRNGEETLMVKRDVDDDDAKVIAEELMTNTSLLSLSFYFSNKIGPEGTRHLSDMLRKNCSLLYLDIYGRDIVPDGVRYTSDMLRKNYSLQYLDIYGREIGDDGARHLSDALRENRSLLYLDIRRNRIGPEGTRHLSNMLRENSTLLYLDISTDCKIDADGARQLSDALRQNSTLLFLYLHWNEICNDGARHLSDMLRHNCTLLYLDISCNQIGPEGARHLSDMLRGNSTLLYLALYCNYIGDEGARHLSDALRENSTLLFLDINKNQIGDDGARHVSDMLRENHSLLYLDILDNEIEDSELEFHIEDEMQSSSSQSRQLSFHKCRLFFQFNSIVPSWTSARQETFFHLDFDQLPPEIWGEILGFLTNDSSSLRESLLTFDLRSGFYFPCPICEFSSKEIPLLSMIPCIEGLFRQDQWTRERFYRLGLRKPLFDEKVSRNWNLDDSFDSGSDSSSSPPLKRTKTT